jgi:hypothetical protein
MVTQIIDVGILIGIMLSVLNGFDFIVRPHQKKIIQDFLEDTTLWLDYLYTPDLSRSLDQRGVQLLIVLCGWTVWTTFVLLAFLPYLFITLPEELQRFF